MSKERYPPVYKSVIKDDPESFFRSAYQRAKKGDTGGADELLHGLCESFEAHESVPAPILEYLYQAFASYLGGEKTIERALLLTKASRRPTGRYAADPIRVVATLYLLMKRDKLGKEAAKNEVEERLHVQKRTIERYDIEWKGLQAHSIDDLEVLAKPVKRLRQ